MKNLILTITIIILSIQSWFIYSLKKENNNQNMYIITHERAWKVLLNALDENSRNKFIENVKNTK